MSIRQSRRSGWWIARRHSTRRATYSACLRHFGSLPTAQRSDLLQKPTVTDYGTRMFITVSTRATYCSPSGAKRIAHSPITFLYSLFLISSHLGLSLPSYFFPSGFPAKLCFPACPAQLSPVISGEECGLRSPSGQLGNPVSGSFSRALPLM